MDYLEIIKDQAERALWSVSNVIDAVPDSMWEKDYCAMPVWKHIYHTLHSLDQWYINPARYKHPAFHVEGLNNLDVPTEKTLSREEIDAYREQVFEKIRHYSDALTEPKLLDYPEDCHWNHMTLILAQHRHLHTHMGMLMGFVIAETGKWPRVIGLELDIPPGEYDLYF